jgi:multidrug resistance efflux pump
MSGLLIPRFACQSLCAARSVIHRRSVQGRVSLMIERIVLSRRKIAMSIDFSRTIRSLNTDSFRVPTLVLICAVLVMVAWLAWFFLAHISLYEVSTSARVTEQQLVEAKFAPEVSGHIQPGQSAQIQLDGFPSIPYGTIPATVLNVNRESDDGQVRVEFTLQSESVSLLQSGLPGTVRVEVARVTPAVLVLRAVGQLVSQ